MIVDPNLEKEIEEYYIISSSCGISSQNESNEVITKMVLTHLLKRGEEINTKSHPSPTSISPSEHISISFCCIILK